MKKNTAIMIEEGLYYMQNDTQKAIDIFDDILEDEPENIEAINGKGSSLMKLNRMDDAEKYFNHSLSLEKTSSALISKGIINKTKKNYEQALYYYDEAIEINPNLNNIITILKNEIFDLIGSECEIDLGKYSPEANELIKKGIEYKNSNRLWDALDCYRKAIKNDETCTNSVKALINEIKSILQNELAIRTPEIDNTHISQLKIKSLKSLLIEENPKKSLTILNIILKEDENEIDALNQKGCILFIFDECEQSLECFDKCLNIDANYTYSLFNKAITLRRLHRLSDALDCFDELLKKKECYDKVKPYQLEILDKLHEQKSN